MTESEFRRGPSAGVASLHSRIEQSRRAVADLVAEVNTGEDDMAPDEQENCRLAAEDLLDVADCLAVALKPLDEDALL